MITAVVLSEDRQRAEALQAALSPAVTVFTGRLDSSASVLPENIPVDLFVIDGEPMTEAVIRAVEQTRALHPRSLVVCAASEETSERARAEEAVSPDFWLITTGSATQVQAQIGPLLALVADGYRRELMEAETEAVALPGGGPSWPGDGYLATTEHSLYRMIRRVAGSADLEELFTAYCDAVQEATRCVSYCLLWREAEGKEFVVVRAEGLPPLLRDATRLQASDPLPLCLQRNRGVVTRENLVANRLRAGILRDIELIGGVLAVPLLSQGVLRGIMVVGPKALGTPYTAAEAEGLFTLSSSAAAAVCQAELHQELAARNKYIAQVLSTMESGVITLGTEGKVEVCNPYAAQVLNLDAEECVGGNLRSLPSPLGDYLYACLVHGEERSREEVVVLGGRVVLRISTRRLMDARGVLIGSMLLLEDTTTERALQEERRKVERNEVINQIVARVAHELKNPLVTVHTFAEVMPKQFEDPEFGQWAELVRRDVRRLDDLVTKLMSLAESPGSDQQVVQIPEIVKLAMTRLEQLDETASTRVISRISGDLPMVRVDPSVMAAALSHLLRFGLGDTQERVTIEAKLYNGASGDRPVALLVRAAAALPADDDPQKLLDPSYVLEHPDIDLGPSASQRLIESQGGVLEVTREASGILFRILLPPYPDPARF